MTLENKSLDILYIKRDILSFNKKIKTFVLIQIIYNYKLLRDICNVSIDSFS